MAGPSPNHGDHKNVVGSVLKACRLLECFSYERRELTLTELAQQTGLNKTTTHRLLQTLTVAGWLQRGPNATYRLTMHLFAIGAIARADLSLHEEALPHLRRLADEFGDTAYLIMPGDGGAICIDLVEGDSPIKVSSVGVGSILPYHAAAGPLALLAWSTPNLDDIPLDGLERFTDATVTDPEQLRARLAAARETGYVVSEQDFLEGVSAVAAPVFDANTEVVATVSLGGTAERFREPRLADIIDRVTQAAQDVSKRLGYPD